MIELNRRKMLQAISVSALALTVSNGSFAQNDQPVAGGTLTVGIIGDDAKGFDPRFTINITENQIYYLLYNTLTFINKDFSIGPELAESWTIEDDGKRYVFTLKEGVEFQDGTPFNAEAVKWNIEQRLDESVGSYLRKQFLPVIASIEVVSDYQVAVNLNYPYPALLAELGHRLGFMMSPAAVGKFGKDFASNPVGSGPFVLKEWVRGSHLVLEKNPKYWDAEKIYLDSIVFRAIPNRLLGLQRIRVGEIDFIDQLSPSDILQVPQDAGIVTLKAPLGRWHALQWQIDKEPFDDSNLRLAIAHAIDRDRIMEVTIAGEGTIANGLFPAEGTWWSSGPLKPPFEYSPEKAKQLLAESKWNPDETLTVNAPSDAIFTRIAQLVAEQLQAIGMKVQLAPVPQSEYYPKVVQRSINFVPTTWVQRADPDILANLLLSSKGGGNTTGINDTEMDKLVEEGRSTSDNAKRREIYRKVDERLVSILPYIPLFFGVEYSAMSKTVQGFSPWADLFPRFRHCWKVA